MKRFKIGFAAIIAILAISVTVASYAGAFKATKAAPTAIDCYTSVAYLPNSPSDCTTQALLRINLENCPSPLPLNKPLVTFTTPVDQEVRCPQSGGKFCCAKVIQVTPSVQNCFKTEQISAVFCKPVE